MMRRRIGSLALFGGAMALASVAWADDAATQINSGDTAWLLVSTALVMLMTPGLAFFYGGLVRRKNVLATMMQSFIMMCVIGLQWVLFGYSLAFGPDHGGIIGGLDWAGLVAVDLNGTSDYAPTVPHVAFLSFQMMFAVITPALITGAFAERMKFSAFLVFSLLWATFVYDPLAHWVWGRGWLAGIGALDFAGGLVVHMSSGFAALAAALMIGKRKGAAMPSLSPHNLPFTILGAALLWFGWFGFNAGSAITAGSLAAIAFLTTNTATCAAALTWVFIEWRVKGRPTALGAATGAVAGLVAITPASGYVTAGGAVLIGLGAGGLCYSATLLRERLRVDDALDVFAVHGVGGMFGAVATGVFAVAAIGGVSGAVQGNVGQVFVQLAAVAATVAFAAGATYVIVKLVDFVLGLRVEPEAEQLGLDLAVHGEAAYQS